MSDGDRWRGSEPPASGPSSPPTLRFDPLATGVGVFVAVAIPIVVGGSTGRIGSIGMIVVLGIVIGLLAGVLAALWVSHRDGAVWRGPQL